MTTVGGGGGDLGPSLLYFAAGMAVEPSTLVLVVGCLLIGRAIVARARSELSESERTLFHATFARLRHWHMAWLFAFGGAALLLLGGGRQATLSGAARFWVALGVVVFAVVVYAYNALALHRAGLPSQFLRRYLTGHGLAFLGLGALVLGIPSG